MELVEMTRPLLLRLSWEGRGATARRSSRKNRTARGRSGGTFLACLSKLGASKPDRVKLKEFICSI